MDNHRLNSQIRRVICLACSLWLVTCGLVYPETIYTKDGRQIQARVSEKTVDTIWYEVVTGDIIEEVGIDIAKVEKVLNDNGNISEYSPGR